MDETVILEPGYEQVRAAATAFAKELAACVDGDSVELPSLPTIALRIRDALACEDVDINRLAELAGADPAFAARIMKIANSALFARSDKPPADLHSAIVRLGTRMVRNTAIAIAAQQVFIGYSSKAIHPELRKIWHHSLHTAAICHLLLTVKRTAVPPEEGFLAGLLHEVGTLFILRRSKDYAALWSDRDAFESVRLEWQGRVGARILAEWDFAPTIVDAVREHDRVDLACGVPIGLTNVVALANQLSLMAENAESLEAVIDALPDFGALTLDEESAFFVLDTAAIEADLLVASLDGRAGDQEKAVSNA